MKDIAEVIQTEMDKRGWDVPKLALKSEVPPQTIYRIVNREVKSPNIKTITALAKAFGISEAQIRGLENYVLKHEEVSLDSIEQRLALVFQTILDTIQGTDKEYAADQVVELCKKAIDVGMKAGLSEEQLRTVIKIMWVK